jgi:hypothetical protein
MLSSSKEPKNIPISISILHDKEYNNLCLLLKSVKSKERRRAFSEKSNDKPDENNYSQIAIKFYEARRKTLKN